MSTGDAHDPPEDFAGKIPLAHPTPTTDPFERALEFARAGRAAEKRRALSDALIEYEKARAALDGMSLSPLLANILRWTGSVHRDLGEPERADHCYQESLHVAETIGTTSGQAAALNCRAVIAQRRGDLDHAVELYRRAARLAAEAGEIRLAGMIEQNLGVLANIRGDLDGALVRYRASLRAFEQVRDDEGMSWVLNNIGMLLNDLDTPDRADAAFIRGLEIARARGDRAMEGTLLTNYAEGLIARRRWADATAALESAEAIARGGGEPARIGETLKFRGVLERERGNPAAADRHFGEALEIARAAADPLLVAELLRERGSLRLAAGDGEGAAADWSQALAGFERLAATLDTERLRARLAELTGTTTSRKGGS